MTLTMLLSGTSASADSRWTDNYQVDAAHSGRMWDAGVLPPLRYAWTAPVTPHNWSIMYPVVRGNLAYVIDKKVDVLKAVSLSTGQTVWQRTLGFMDFSTGNGPFLAIDEGRIFVTDDAIKPGTTGTVVTLVEAFNSLTGAPLWSAYPVGDQPAEPITSNGVLYLDTTDDAGNRAALRESDGAVLWDVNNGYGPNETYSGGLMTLTAAGLIGMDPCGGAVLSDPLTGRQLFNHLGVCSGPDALLGVAAGNDVWFGDPDVAQGDASAGNIVMDPATGATVGTMPVGTSPVFADGLGFQLREVNFGGGRWGADLAAFDPATGATRWVFTHEGVHDLATLPLAADGYVFAASKTGTVWAFNPPTGAMVWSYHPNSPLTVYWQNGLAAGNGDLVLLTRSGLIGFRGAGMPSGPAPAVWTAVPPLPGH